MKFSPVMKRLMMLSVIACLLGGAAWLVSMALRENITLFFTPSELTNEYRNAKKLRLGGIVKKGSILQTNENVRFQIADEIEAVTVLYAGILPDLFREEQGIIVEGAFEIETGEELFRAVSVLAKHDENYMPRELADSLKKQGRWKGERE